tara:strand:- start:2707 stop:2919 length:213 start_codon:yes stop_codon:yes gene_type:complete
MTTNNRLYEVLVWTDQDVDEYTGLTFEEAVTRYNSIYLGEGDRGKQIMLYESLEDDADGECIEELWRDDE